MNKLMVTEGMLVGCLQVMSAKQIGRVWTLAELRLMKRDFFDADYSADRQIMRKMDRAIAALEQAGSPWMPERVS
jgi:hypothetical protein